MEAGSPSSKSARGSSGLVPLEGRIGGYELVARLGRGGAAEVFLARGPERALVVLKRLRDDAGDLAAAEDALLDEARLAERLVHPCIARTLGSGIEDGRRFLLLEPLAGQPLERLVDKAACEAERCALVAMLARALSGLHHAHEALDERGSSLGVVHRDVSPHNLFVTYDGEVKVLDFGIALAASRSCATTTGLVKGKIAYMAPEQALSMPVDRRADVFSSGVVLAELWSGRRFWSGASDVQILRALTFGEVPEACSLVDEPALSAIVARATQVDPAARYESALELREALVAWLAAEGRAPWLAGGQRLEREYFASLVRRWFGDEQRLLAELVAGARGATAGPAAVLEPSALDGSLGERAAPLQLEGAAREGDDAVASSERTQGNVALAVPRRERRGLAWVALALGLVGAAAAGLWWRRPSAGARSEPARTEGDARSGDVRHVRMTLQVFPTEATIELDGALVPTNPFTARVPLDGVAHRLRVEAPGFEPVDRLLVLERDDVISVRLEPTPPSGERGPARADALPSEPRSRGAQGGPRPRAALAPAPVPSGAAGPAALPAPKLDTRDPWAP